MLMLTLLQLENKNTILTWFLSSCASLLWLSESAALFKQKRPRIGLHGILVCIAFACLCEIWRALRGPSGVRRWGGKKSEWQSKERGSSTPEQICTRGLPASLCVRVHTYIHTYRCTDAHSLSCCPALAHTDAGSTATEKSLHQLFNPSYCQHDSEHFWKEFNLSTTKMRRLTAVTNCSAYINGKRCNAE